jgi:SAM-dependent methyltransferase
MQQPDRQSVIENERRFHNERFTEETREAQGKYYASIKHGSLQFENRVLEISRAADVLEYGCGSAIQGIRIAREATTLTGIDISDVAVRDAQAVADKEGLTNVRYHVMNAEEMTFEDDSFDLVFGRGIIHHLDLDLSFHNIARVLRPGGRALFWEPLGHNPVLNRYRDMTPDARTPDEHPLRKSDFDIAKKYLQVDDLKFFGLSTILSVPFRDTDFGDFLLRTTSAVDQVMFKTPARWMAWHVLMEIRKSR